MPSQPPETLAPAASVLIPSSGRPLVLELVLDGLCLQDAGGAEFEVIVVDDGSVPPLADRLQPYASRLNLRSIRLERAGPGSARNAAARLAASNFLIFLDDDCVPGPGWLKAYLAALAENPEAALAGPIVNALPGNLCSEACHLIFGYLFSRHLAQIRPDGNASHAPFIISANLAVSAQLFSAVGGFDARFRVAAEDRMFSEEWVRSGRDLRAVPEAVVHHHRPLSVLQYAAQQFRYGRGGMIFRKALRKRAWQGRPMEGRSFYIDLLTTAFRHKNPWWRLPLFLLLLLSQTAIATGYLVEYPRAALGPRQDSPAL